MTACRYPGCTTRPTVKVDADEAWCRSHARQEADRLLRQFVMERDQRICQRCGGSAHDAAHLIPRARAPYLHWITQNVVALCRSCHAALDGSPAVRTVWTEARYPMLLERLWTMQLRAEGDGLHVDLGQVIKGLREPELTPAEAARYEAGEW